MDQSQWKYAIYFNRLWNKSSRINKLIVNIEYYKKQTSFIGLDLLQLENSPVEVISDVWNYMCRGICIQK